MSEGARQRTSVCFVNNIEQECELDGEEGVYRCDAQVPAEEEAVQSSVGRAHVATRSIRYAQSLAKACLAEAVGTAMIVIIGCGSVATAVATGAPSGLWQVAVVWGFGVTLAILCTAEASGAHLNPAITLAFTLVRPQAHGMTWLRAALYWAAQLLGAIVGGAIHLGLMNPQLKAYERANGIIRGSPESLATASAFGEYFPNPGFVGSPFNDTDVSPLYACVIEAWGTAVLAMVIFSLTHPRNSVAAGTGMVPYFIGFTVSVLISLYAPITQAGWNPARDFGPRVVAALAGWGEVAIPGPRNGFWVYIVGPMVGGPLGAAVGEYIMWQTRPKAIARPL